MKPVQIIDTVPFAMDSGLLRSGLRIKPGTDLDHRLSAMARDAEAVARPKAAYRPVDVVVRGAGELDIEGVMFTSRLLEENLVPAAARYAFIATCGAELDAWAAAFTDLLERYWADMFMQLALAEALKTLEHRLSDACSQQTLACMNPGSLADWPLTEQRPLFQLLADGLDRLGVALSASCLITPLKSVSGIYFDSRTQFCNCTLCPREACPNRRMPYLHG